MALTDKLTAIADAIRSKSGTTDQLTLAGMVDAINAIQTGGGSGGGQAFQCGSVVSADGTNLVVPCTLDNILIVRKYTPSSTYTAYLLNETLLVADGLKIQIASDSRRSLVNQGTGTFLITKEFGQSTFTQEGSIKFAGEYCYIAWDNAE